MTAMSEHDIFETSTPYSQVPVGYWNRGPKHRRSHARPFRLETLAKITTKITLTTFVVTGSVLSAGAIATATDVSTAGHAVGPVNPGAITRVMVSGFAGLSGGLDGTGIAPVESPRLGEDSNPIGGLDGGEIARLGLLEDWEAKIIADALHEMDISNNRKPEPK